MSTKKEIAQSMALLLRQHGASAGTVKNVQIKIDKLVYSKSQTPLSNADKLEIIDEIKDIIITQPQDTMLQFRTKHYSHESHSSDDLIELINAIGKKYK
ncbi:MAG: hypothetical protein FWD47_12320 [Treponema sp.]|nr:hypothetical protein [Treponema sp.]